VRRISLISSSASRRQVLIIIIGLTPKPADVKDRATLYALGALSACVNKNSKEFLLQKLQESTEDKVKATITRLLEQIENAEKDKGKQ
jgi:hypothetical protein